jgi:hypothetical protein
MDQSSVRIRAALNHDAQPVRSGREEHTRAARHAEERLGQIAAEMDAYSVDNRREALDERAGVWEDAEIRGELRDTAGELGGGKDKRSSGDQYYSRCFTLSARVLLVR